MSVWKWAEWIHPVPEVSRISLGEGNTPLVRSQRIGPKSGLDNLWFKVEGGNPSGSYKDRFAAVAVNQHAALDDASGTFGFDGFEFEHAGKSSGNAVRRNGSARSADHWLRAKCKRLQRSLEAK